MGRRRRGGAQRGLREGGCEVFERCGTGTDERLDLGQSLAAQLGCGGQVLIRNAEREVGVGQVLMVQGGLPVSKGRDGRRRSSQGKGEE